MLIFGVHQYNCYPSVAFGGFLMVLNEITAKEGHNYALISCLLLAVFVTLTPK